MEKSRLSKRFWVAVLVCLAATVSYSEAFAWGGPKHGRQEVRRGNDRPYHYDNRFYKPGWFGFEFLFSSFGVGAVVRTLPPGYGTIIVGGSPYYYHGHNYYRKCPTGYVIVENPTVYSHTVYAAPVAAPQALSGNTVRISVPNNRGGGYTEVILVKTNNGYIGPQGEYYAGNPSIAQLSALYGR